MKTKSLPCDPHKTVLHQKVKEEFLAFMMRGIESPSCGQTPKEMIAEIKSILWASSQKS